MSDARDNDEARHYHFAELSIARQRAYWRASLANARCAYCGGALEYEHA